jgi:hypothetical protein
MIAASEHVLNGLYTTRLWLIPGPSLLFWATLIYLLVYPGVGSMVLNGWRLTSDRFIDHSPNCSEVKAAKELSRPLMAVIRTGLSF